MRRVEDLNATRRIDQRDTSKLNFPCVKLIDPTRRFYQVNVLFFVISIHNTCTFFACVPWMSPLKPPSVKGNAI